MWTAADSWAPDDEEYSPFNVVEVSPFDAWNRAYGPTATTEPSTTDSPINNKVLHRSRGNSLEYPMSALEAASDSGSSSSLNPDDVQAPSIPKPMGMKKNVSFGHLEELAFIVEKGDASMYELAYPMQLGERCVSETTHTVDEYEEERAPIRRRENELRTSNSEERRKIIKNSQKVEKEIMKELKKHRKHRRNNSIGNGQISRIHMLYAGSSPKLSIEEANRPQSERLGMGRPTLLRQNSIGNGQITRDKRRNRVQDFLKRLTTSKKTTNPSPEVSEFWA